MDHLLGRSGEKPGRWGGVRVNDMHAQLNATVVREIERPISLAELQRIVRRAREEKKAVCIAGARHAMGGQQFAADGLLVDMSHLKRVLHFDRERGQVEVEAGILWVDLVNHLIEVQYDQEAQWCILQKQTGAEYATREAGCAGTARLSQTEPPVPLRGFHRDRHRDRTARQSTFPRRSAHALPHGRVDHVSV